MRASRVARHIVVLFALIFLPFANADATPILPSPGEPDLVGDWNLLPPSAPGHEGILGFLYGWNNLTRVDDFGGGLVDQWWSFAPGAEARALSMFAGNSFDFGFLDASSVFHNILSYDGEPGYINFPAVPFASSELFNRFALRTASETVFNSAQAEDHMVTFQITGNTDQYGRDFSANIIGNYILGWEDLPFFMSDRDYNDFVLEVSGVRPTSEPMPVIPEPATAVLLASGLAAMAYFRRSRSRPVA
jgi:hypothetical protein